MATFWEIAQCSLGWPYFLLVRRLFVILVISFYGFEGGIWVLIVPVPGHCILVLLCTQYETIIFIFLQFKYSFFNLSFFDILRRRNIRVSL